MTIRYTVSEYSGFSLVDHYFLKQTGLLSDKFSMKLPTLFIYMSAVFLLTSCASYTPLERRPAEAAPTCMEMVKNFFSSKKSTESYEDGLQRVLKERKLVTFQEKFVQIQHPRLDWINRVKKSFNQSLRNWNNNRYPAFYLFSEEEIVPLAKRYAESVEKIAMNQVPVNDEETTKAFVSIGEWIKAYKNYKTDMDQLIEERISLQYNVSLLKKLKLDNDPRDIQLTIKRAGELKTEVITLRKEDKNLKLTINNLKAQMKELDGTLIRNGKIKDRIIRQAMLQDMLTILQREMEYASKNGFESEALTKEIDSIASLIKEAEFSPTTYGVYKIENKVFIRELLATSKLDILYNKFRDPVNKLKTIVTDYFKNRNAGTDAEKIGIFKRIYAKITSITPKQAAVGGGSVVVAGIGAERYFSFKQGDTKEVKDRTSVVELGPEDQAHEQQLENTEKVETEKHEAHSQVIELNIEELTK